jgi:hypothetical protein
VRSIRPWGLCTACGEQIRCRGAGIVNANKRHWYKAGEILARAGRAWLERLVTRREPQAEFMCALQRQPEDIKVVIQFAQA